jgi:hypothetical protein
LAGPRFLVCIREKKLKEVSPRNHHNKHLVIRQPQFLIANF